MNNYLNCKSILHFLYSIPQTAENEDIAPNVGYIYFGAFLSKRATKYAGLIQKQKGSLMHTINMVKLSRCSIAYVSVAIFALANFSSAIAADFRFAQNNSQPGVPILYMSGEIREGDTGKLIHLLRSDLEMAPLITDIWLNSPGGELNEAIKIGGLIESLGYSAVVPTGSTCASACFFIWVSASSRFAFGDIIIHRPYYNMRNDSQSASGFEERYRITSEAASLYLRQRNVPVNLIDLMMKVSSTDGYTLTENDKSDIGYLSSARNEYMVQNCGLPDPDKLSYIADHGGLTPLERKTIRECGLKFYKRQKQEFFFGKSNGSR